MQTKLIDYELTPQQAIVCDIVNIDPPVANVRNASTNQKRAEAKPSYTAQIDKMRLVALAIYTGNSQPFHASKPSRVSDILEIIANPTKRGITERSDAFLTAVHAVYGLKPAPLAPFQLCDLGTISRNAHASFLLSDSETNTLRVTEAGRKHIGVYLTRDNVKAAIKA